MYKIHFKHCRGLQGFVVWLSNSFDEAESLADQMADDLFDWEAYDYEILKMSIFSWFIIDCLALLEKNIDELKAFIFLLTH